MIPPHLTRRYERLGRLVHAWVVAMRAELASATDDHGRALLRTTEEVASLWRSARGWYGLALRARDSKQAAHDAGEAVRLMERASEWAIGATRSLRRRAALRGGFVGGLTAGWESARTAASDAVDAAAELAADVTRPAVTVLRLGLAVAVLAIGAWVWRRSVQ